MLALYLFLEAHSFPRVMLSEDCSLLGTDIVSADKYPSIFPHQIVDIALDQSLGL